MTRPNIVFLITLCALSLSLRPTEAAPSSWPRAAWLASEVDWSTHRNEASAECEQDTIAPVIVYPASGLQAALPSCSQGNPAVFFFSLTVADNCDSLPVYELEITGGTPENIQLYNPYGSHYMATVLPGSYELTVEAADEAGNTRSVAFSIEVSQAPGQGANYACNDTVVVHLDEQCRRVLTPDMVLEGAIGCTPPEYFNIEVLDSLPDNGQIVDGRGAFPFELTPVQPSESQGFTNSANPIFWQLSTRGDADANWQQDSLALTAGPGTGWSSAVWPVALDGNLAFDYHAMLPGEATTYLSIQLLNPDGTVEEEAFLETAAAGPFEAAVEQGQTLWLSLVSDSAGETGEAYISNWSITPEAIDLSNLFSCWGTILSRDVIPPQLSCPPDTDEATLLMPAQQLSGSITAQSPTLSTASHSCLVEGTPAGGEQYYDIQIFEVQEAGVFTFFLNTSFTEGHGQLALFQGGFSPLSPCSNIIAQHDFPESGNPFSGGSSPFVRLTLPLQAGQLYYLLTLADTPGATGGYTYTVFSDGSGLIGAANTVELPFTQPLFCEDLGFLQQTGSLHWTGAPLATDGCSTPELDFVDEVLEEGDCGTLAIQRTFAAVDAAGNETSCQQQIRFRRPTVEDIALPPSSFPIDCNQNYPVDEQGNPDPSVSGYPFVLTLQGARDLSDTYCNLGASYSDSPSVQICEGSYKFLRNWNITDWCDPTASFSYGQFIKIGDFTAPLVDCPTEDFDGDGVFDPLVYPTQPFECMGAFPAPLPDVTDNCSGWEVLTQIVTFRDSIVYGAGNTPTDTLVLEDVLATIPHDAPNRFVTGIPTGCHAFRYVVTDACGNSALKYCTFCVEDQTEPVADCNEALHVSLSTDGSASVSAASVDEGSWDNCAIGQLQVRRLLTQGPDCSPVDSVYSGWADAVAFTCCDADSLVAIELLVRDTAGNENTCWAEILVEDKVRPKCLPPPDQSISCDSLPAGFQADSLAALESLFGAPAIQDNCAVSWQELEPLPMLDECGVGTIVRRFQAVDESGNVSTGACRQEISVVPKHDYEIRFPKDAASDCGIPNPDTIEVFELACDLLAVSVSDTIFAASGDECYKIFRTYRVINWCEYDGESAPVVIGRDEDCDEQPGDEDVWVLRRPGHAFVDRDNDHQNAIPAAGEKGTVCGTGTNPEGYWRTVSSNGYWQYKQHIKVYDDEPPEILFVPPLDVCSINNETCRASAEYLFSVLDNCTPDDLTIEVYYDEFSDGTVDSVITDVFGTYPKWKVDGDWPIGQHEFEIRVEDGCGNQASATMPFRIVDCKAPAPTCLNGLSVPLMPVPPQTDVDGDGDFDRGAMTVFANEFIASPYTDCSDPVVYSINRVGEMPNRDQSSIILTCDDLGALVVEIYAWDSADNPYAVQPDGTTGGPNYDNCETFVLVTNNLADCNANLPVIAGVIEREDSAAVAGVTANLSGIVSESVLTDSLGGYTFTGLEPNYDYTVTPFLDGDDQNGLTTYDVVLITQHILGIQHLASPYQRIAADVNNSGSISTLDVILLRQVILSILLEFPNSPSWRFVPRSHQFEDPTDPWLQPVPYSVTYNDLTASLTSEDYVAIKIGDIDLSAQVDGLQAVEERAGPAFQAELRLEDRELQVGERVTLPLYGTPGSIIGLQAHLEAEEHLLEIEAVRPGSWSEAFYRSDARQLAISWNGAPGKQPGQPALYLQLRARQPHRLSEALHLSETARLRPEAYDRQLRKGAVSLAFDRPSGELSVRPNPANGPFSLHFSTDTPGTTELRVYTQDGQLCRRATRFHEAGQHQWDMAPLPGAGLYLVRLSNGQRTWVKRLICTR